MPLVSFFFRCWWALMWWRGSQMLKQPFMHVSLPWIFNFVHYWFVLSASISPLLARQALNMLQPYRKNHVTCLSLLSELAEAPSRSASIGRTMPTSNGMTLRQKFCPRAWYVRILDARSPLSIPFGSPEFDYFRGSGRVKPASSRWKEDWEELELLVSYSLVPFLGTLIDYA